jgi:hypothetical protein
MHIKLCSENQKGRDHFEGLGVDGESNKIGLGERGWKDVDWIHLS